MTITAGSKATAAQITAEIGASAKDVQVTGGTVTSTTYTPTLSAGATAGINFVAPASGKVDIFYAAQTNNSGVNNTFITPHVRTGAVVGSGADVLAASDDNAIINTGTAAFRIGGFYPLVGLTAGSPYNVKLEVRVSAGTATVSRTTVNVMPA